MIQIEDLEKRITALEQLIAPAETHTEPRPLLADAEVGWICRHRNGAYSQIGGIDYPCPVTDCISIGKNRYDRDGKHSGEDMRLNPNPDLDIISAEPLAEVGTKERALQDMKLGNKVIAGNPDNPRERQNDPYWITENCVCYQNEKNITCKVDDFLEIFKDCTWVWQLYEPKPESDLPVHGKMSLAEIDAEIAKEKERIARWKYADHNMGSPSPQPQVKVGDWVEYMGNQLMLIGIPIGETIPDIKSWFAQDINGNEVRIYTDNITRKLDPAEVRVKITMDGTVSQDKILYGASCFTLKTGRSEYVISLHEIEEGEFVESLLKAQEGEK